MTRRRPGTHTVAPYVGVSGWVGVVLDTAPDWHEVARLVREAYLHVATAKLRTLAAAELGTEHGTREMPSVPGVDATGKETAHHAGAPSP